MATVIIMLSDACIKEAAQSESAPSNDYVKQFAATLLHNECLFILFPRPFAALFGGKYL